MATIVQPQRSRTERDRAFFLIMALAIAATIVAGFSLNVVEARSSFAAPWWVHVHGLTFMGWLAIYVTQNALIYSGDVALHRRLGWVACFYLAWAIPVGLAVNTLSAMSHRIPPFFETNVFLVMDWATILTFAGLTISGIVLRRRIDWHRRLMLCGALELLGPGVGRLMPLPLMGTWIIWSIWCAILIYAGIGMTYDVMTRGRVHPAWFWGFGTITLVTALMRPLAFTPPMLALTAALTG